jgi:histidinol-phosphate aminotransferase
MEKRLVKIANAILELDRFDSDQVPHHKRSPRLLRLDSSESTVGPSPGVRAAVKNFVDSISSNNYCCYEDELRESLATYTTLPKEAIRSFNGSGEAFENIARTYLEPGVEIVFSAPVGGSIERTALSTGAGVLPVRHENPFETYIEALINSIGPKTRMVYISNPNELSGACFTEAEIVFLLAYAERVMVVVDERAYEFCGHSVAELVTRFPNLVVTRTFSGAFGLGSAPLEYALTDPVNLIFIDRVRNNAGQAPLAQVAAIAALKNLAFMHGFVDAVAESRKMLWRNLPQSGYEFHLTPANFFLLKVADSGQAVELLLADGIAVKRLTPNEGLDGYLRITIGTPEQTERLLVSLSKLAAQMATGFNRNRLAETVNRVAPDVTKTVAAAR